MQDETLIQTEPQITTGLETIQSLPFGVHSIPLLAVIAGVVLLFFGARVVKPAFALCGLVVGATIGTLGPPLFGFDEIQGHPSPYFGMAAGGLVGLVVAMLVVRLTIVVLSAGVFAIAGFLSGAVYLQFNPTPESTPEDPRGTDPLTEEVLLDSFDEEGDFLTPDPEGMEAKVVDLFIPTLDDRIPEGTPASKVLGFSRHVEMQARDRWSDVPYRDRLVHAGSIMVGAALGLLFGLVMPTRSTAFVTALAGSSILMSSSGWLSEAINAPGREVVMERSAMTIGILWVALAAFGFFWQVRKRTPAGSGGDGD